MYFLHPLFLAGLAAAAVPLLVHLLRHRRVNKVRFSTLSFLRLLHKKHSLRIRIDQMLLLLTRILLAAALAVLFAQPFFTLPELTFLNSGPRHVICLLDNSGSMTLRTSADRLLYGQAVAGLARLAAGLTSREALTVIALAPRARVVFRGKQEDLDLSDLPSVHPGSGDLEGALRLAEATFLEKPGSDRIVAVFSDFSEMDVPALGAPGARLLLFPLQAEGASNLAVGPISLDAEQVSVGEPVTLRVPVSSHGAPFQGQVSLNVGGKVLDRRFLPPGVGQTQLIFVTRFNRPGTHSIVVEAGEDSLEGDNRSHTIVDVVEQRRVQIITGRPLLGGEGVRDPLFFLRRGLGHATLNVSNGPENLEGTALIVLLRPDLLAPEEGSELVAHVKNGGNLIAFIPPDEVDPEAANRSLFSGMGVLKLGKKVEAAARWSGPGLASPGAFVDPRFWQGVTSSARFLIEPGAAYRSAGVRAQFEDGTPAVYVSSLGRGSLAVVNAGMGLSGSDLPLHPIFPIFLNRLAAWSPERLRTYTVGEEIHFAVPLEEFGASFQVLSPGDRVSSLSPIRRGRSLVLPFSDTSRVGTYRLDRTRGDSRDSQHFIVAWPEEESTLTYPSEEELRRLLPSAALSGDAGLASETGRLPVTVSDLLLSLVVLLMLFECWLVFDLERQISRTIEDVAHA